ncbi:unnamed protein product [Sphagnum tenellum]
MSEDEVTLRLEIENPRTIKSELADVEPHVYVSWHSPEDPVPSGRPAGLDGVVVVEEDWRRHSGDSEHLFKVIELLRRELADKEKVMRDVIRSNAENVKKATQHIEKLEASFREKLRLLQVENESLRGLKATQLSQIRELTSAVNSQNADVASLHERLKRRSVWQQSDEAPPEIFHPTVSDLNDNGVFVLREKEESVLCIKLPLAVEVEGSGSKVKVMDQDVASVSRFKVGKRQAAVAKVVELLFNPLSVKMTTHRCQHLIWILLSDVFNKFGFKDPKDKYLLGPNDYINVKPELVIKTRRPDLAMNFMPGPSIKSRELEIRKHLPSAAMSMSSSVGRGQAQTFKSLVGPKSKTAVPAHSVLRDLGKEMQLLKAARWNSANGRFIFNDNNRRFLHSVVPCHVPGVSDPKHNLNHVLVGFIRALNSTGFVYLPFLVLPKNDAKDTSLPVRSNEVEVFEYGSVFDIGMQLICPMCSMNIHEVALPEHMTSHHDLNMILELQLKPISEPAIVERPLANFSGNKFWSFKVFPEAKCNFSTIDSEPLFYFEKDKQTPEETESFQVKTEKDDMCDSTEGTFRCRFCDKAFTTVAGWDSHVDSAHCDLMSFMCPNKTCLFCCGTKIALVYHIQQCSETKRNKEKKDKYDKLEKSSPRTADLQQQRSPTTTSVPSKENPCSSLARKDKSSFSEATSMDAIVEQEELLPPSSSNLKMAKTSSPEVVQPSAAGALLPDAVCFPSQKENEKKRKMPLCNDDYVKRDENKLKRRQKHPQVAFTAILKEIIISINTYITTSKIVLWKERHLNLNKRAFKIIEVEDKVDANMFSTIQTFSDCFKQFCESVMSRNADDEVIAEVGKDLIQYCEGELHIRRTEMERLQSEINPMLSTDPVAALKHIFVKIMEEDVMTMRVAHRFQRLMAKDNGPKYCKVVKNPVFLETISQRARTGWYATRREFLKDFSQMHKNCIRFHGKASDLSQDAKIILAKSSPVLHRHKGQLLQQPYVQQLRHDGGHCPLHRLLRVRELHAPEFGAKDAGGRVADARGQDPTEQLNSRDTWAEIMRDPEGQRTPYEQVRNGYSAEDEDATGTERGVPSGPLESGDQRQAAQQHAGQKSGLGNYREAALDRGRIIGGNDQGRHSLKHEEKECLDGNATLAKGEAAGKVEKTSSSSMGNRQRQPVAMVITRAVVPISHSSKILERITATTVTTL